jgi:Fur family ferric uptake transcriptional regulator
MTADAPTSEMSPEEAIEAALELLRARGQRITGARSAVIEALARLDDHPSAERLYERVRALHPTVHRATVYRTLDTLTALGVVTHVHTGGGATAYHLAPRVTPGHLHAQCRDCDRIVDLPGDLLDPIVDRLSREDVFELHPTHVALSGRCRECRAAER